MLQPAGGRFSRPEGPIFANIVLADEINRAPPKVPVRPARGHAGATGHHRRGPYPSCRAPFPRPGHAEPHRAGGHLPPPRGSGRPLHAQASASPTRPGTRSATILGRMTSIARGSPIGPPRGDPRGARGARTIYVDEKIKEYIVDIVFATREPEATARATREAHRLTAPVAPRDDLPDHRRPRARLLARDAATSRPEDIKAVGRGRAAPPRHRDLRGRGRGLDRDGIVRRITSKCHRSRQSAGYSVAPVTGLGAFAQLQAPL